MEMFRLEHVNAVAPTYINTPLNTFVFDKPKMYEGGSAARRWGGWGDSQIASVVLFHAGEVASLMTGSVVVVDGGYTCS